MANTIDSMLSFLATDLCKVETENDWTHYKFSNGLDVAYKSYGDTFFKSTGYYMSGKALMLFEKTGLISPEMVSIKGIYPYSAVSKFNFGGLTARKDNSTTYRIDALVIGAQDYSSIICIDLSAVAIGTWK